ncbi:hypothetical protein K440DRAFT_639212 [Wilcoxina mikolae CBS 423.85]|nr:hypothetical protein K440DRAFT_639212 [Wilcoxina mikolae CBS 423.85]
MQPIQLFSVAVFLGALTSAASIERRTETVKCGYQTYIVGDLCPIKKKPYMISYPCGKDCYFDDEYNCFEDKMCPKPLAPEICWGPGGWSCYDPLKYKCEDGMLSPA